MEKHYKNKQALDVNARVFNYARDGKARIVRASSGEGGSVAVFKINEPPVQVLIDRSYNPPRLNAVVYGRKEDIKRLEKELNLL